MTDKKKKFVKSVERKGGMIEVKNTGKGQAQGQAVKINIKIGDSKAQKEKKEKEEKKAKKRRATKRAKKKLIEQIQEDLKLIQNLKNTAKDRGIAIPAELGALPISVPSDMKGLIALQREMSERVLAIQQYIQSQSEASETPRIQPQIIRGSGIPAPPIEFQQELIKSRQRIQELTPGFQPTQPVDESAKQKEIDDAKKRLKELSDRARKKREEMLNPTQPIVSEDSTKLIDDLLTGNIKKMKKQLQERVKKGILTQAQADKLLQNEIDTAKQAEDTAISAKIGERERAEFDELIKEKIQYETELQKVADKIIAETKSRQSTFYTIDKKDVESLDVMRGKNFMKSQDYQNKYGRLIAENRDIYGDFFNQSNLFYQPDDIIPLLNSLIQNKEPTFKREIQAPPTLTVKQIKERLDEIEMLYDDINKDINDTKKEYDERATPSLVKRVQSGLGEVDKEINDLAKGNMSGDGGRLILTTINSTKFKTKRGKITRFLTNIKQGATPVVDEFPANYEKDKASALKRLREWIATTRRKPRNVKIKDSDYEISGFRALIGNKNEWNLAVKGDAGGRIINKTRKNQLKDINSFLRNWLNSNPDYDKEPPEPKSPDFYSGLKIPSPPVLELEPDFSIMPIDPGNEKVKDLSSLLTGDDVRDLNQKRERQRQKQQEKKPPPEPKFKPSGELKEPIPRPGESTLDPLATPFVPGTQELTPPPRQERAKMKAAQKVREQQGTREVNFGEPEDYLIEQ